MRRRNRLRGSASELAPSTLGAEREQLPAAIRPVAPAFRDRGDSSCVSNGHLGSRLRACQSPPCSFYAIRDLSLPSKSSLGDSIELFIRREDAERFIEEVRSDDPDLASYLRIEEREMEAGGLIVRSVH